MRCAKVSLRIEARAYLLVLPGLPRRSSQPLLRIFSLRQRKNISTLSVMNVPRSREVAPAQSDISNNVGPVKHFLSRLLSFRLKEFFSFVFFRCLPSQR